VNNLPPGPGIPLIGNAANQPVIEMLKAALDRAREGKTLALGIVEIFAEGSVSTDQVYRGGSPDVWLLHAGASVLQRDLLHLATSGGKPNGRRPA
jgi:hypothetical protein